MEFQQVTPLTWRAVADWCGGTAVVDEDGNQAVDLPNGSGRAALGWWVARDADEVLSLVDPGTYNQTYRS